MKWNLSSFSIIILFIALTLVGLFIVPLLSVKLNPNTSLRSLSIDFTWAGNPATNIEQVVTSKIEGIVSTVEGARNLRSVSSNGQGKVSVDLDDKANIDIVRVEISTLLRRVFSDFPPGVTYPIVSVRESSNGGKSSVMTYTVQSLSDAAIIQEFAESHIRPALALVNGIYQVDIYGADDYAWNLQYNPYEMKNYGVSVQDLYLSVTQYFKKFDIGKVYLSEEHNSGFRVSAYANLQTIQSVEPEWHKIPVKRIGSRVLYLTDLTKVVYTQQKSRSYHRINGLNAITVDIKAAEGVNSIVIANAIKSRMAQVQTTMPSGFSMSLISDSTQALKNELNRISIRTLITLLVLLGFVLAITRKIKYLLVILLSLMCTLLISCILYYVFNLDIQLYSLVAIIISIGMIVSSTIIVIEHISKKDSRINPAIIGSSLAMMGAACVILFIDDEMQIKLSDFAAILIINLAVSLLISLVFVPALLHRFSLSKGPGSNVPKNLRLISLLNKFHSVLIVKSLLWRKVLFLTIFLLFGTPIFLLPEKVDGEGVIENVYNSAVRNSYFVNSIQPWMEKVLGGTLRLFVVSFDSSEGIEIFSQGETQLNISITMPEGTVVDQMNGVALSLENYLSQFKEINMFRTRVDNGQHSLIEIEFKKGIDDAFPEKLKSDIEKKIESVGLAEFKISGVGEGFSNEINTDITEEGIILQGYNLAQLSRLADRTKTILQEVPRIDKINITAERDIFGNDSKFEYVFRIKGEPRFPLNELTSSTVLTSLSNFSTEQINAAYLLYGSRYVPVRLSPTGEQASIWQVMNESIQSDSLSYLRLSEIAELDKELFSDKIIRENQQYQLVLNFNFIGSKKLSSKVVARAVEQVRAELPIGYYVKHISSNFWAASKAKLIWAIFLSIIIVFFICTFFLNSLPQSLAIVSMIPISFIGVFICKYLFNYHFDEGGYMSFIMLAGITVGAPLFILNDFNNLKNKYPGRSELRLFLKAYNSKALAILLSGSAMILSLIPFIVIGHADPFWYAFSMSVTSGLFFSLVTVPILLPIFLLRQGQVNNAN